MINLETPRKFAPLVAQAHQVATEVFRPISRRYDREEHTRPKELDMLAALIDGMNDSGELGGTGATGVRRDANGNGDGGGVRNGSNMSTALSVMELCWGDVGLLLSMPRQGLGNSAIASVANDEQLERFAGRWAAMAITEPEAGSDSASIRTTAVLDGDDYVLNGEKIYVTAGERADLVVVWASLDRSKGRAAIKSFVVERSNPGMKLIRTEDKLGIRASDTAAFSLEDCRVPKENLLGQPGHRRQAGLRRRDADLRQHAPAGGGDGGRAHARLPRAHARGVGGGRRGDRPRRARRSASPPRPPSCWRWRPTTRPRACSRSRPRGWPTTASRNSLQASYAKAKAGRTCVDVSLRCVELCGATGYGEAELLEKWARDAKILDIFEGTQQIQLLIIARQLLGKTSAELK